MRIGLPENKYDREQGLQKNLLNIVRVFEILIKTYHYPETLRFR